MDALDPLQDGGARISHGRSFHALDHRARPSRRRGSMEADASHGIASGARMSKGHPTSEAAPRMPVLWPADFRPQTEVLVCELLLSLPVHVAMHDPCTHSVSLIAEPSQDNGCLGSSGGSFSLADALDSPGAEVSDADSLGAESLVEGQVPRRRERRSQVIAPQRSQVDMPQLPRIRVRAEAPLPEVRPPLAPLPDVALSARSVRPWDMGCLWC